MANEVAERTVDGNVPKRVAKDGSKRGIGNKGKKQRHTILLENIAEAVERDTGIKDWDPVVQMAVVAARAFTGYPAVDERGQPVLEQAIDEAGNPRVDDDGNPLFLQVMVPPDPTLAVAAAAKVAPYLHQQMRPRDVAEEGEGAKDPDETKDKVLSAFENMGVKVEREEGE